MINGARVLGLIPARGGSKAVPRKNLRNLGGKPLLEWTASAAKQSRYIDRLILSTDDDEIATLAETLGVEVPFRRPAEAASDTAPAAAVVIHALDAVNEVFDYVVYLQPTSPFRTSADIDACVRLAAERDASACVSVQLVDKRPEWMYRLDGDRLVPLMSQPLITRRQDIADCYSLNGAVYVADVPRYRENGTFLVDGDTAGYVMPRERSIDIDEELDFVIAEAVLSFQRTRGHGGS